MKPLKKMNIMLAATACTAVIASAVFALSPKPSTHQAQPSQELSNQSLVKTAAPDARRYTVREYGGNIAVFNEDGTVHSVYEVNVELLPEYDRGLLKNGITIIGERELRSIVEDYTS